jgi:Zn-dependent protease/CBS domain-containing protein
VRWSYKIARVAGIDIYVHATFLLLLAWIGFAAYRGGGTAAAVQAVGYIVALFTIVVMHEYGHALTARRYGIPTQDITLLPIGGVARLQSMPKDPRQELAIALAGPAVNVALALIIAAIMAATGGFAARAEPTPGTSGLVVGGGILRQLLWVNIVLILFNLIPAFPMDGGRVLRALLAMRSGDYSQATVTAARVGRFFALVFGIVGLFWPGAPATLVLIALFVWLGAAGEAAGVTQSAALDGVPIQRVMITDLRTLAPSDPLSRAAEFVLAGFQQDFPVVDRGALVGVLTRSALIQALGRRPPSTAVAEVMHRDFQIADPTEPVESALARLRTCGCQSLPVVRGRELLGLLTLENVGEYMMIQAAMHGRGGRA